MFFKLSIFCLVALVLAQEALSAHVQQSDEQLARGLGDKVKQALRMLETKVMQLVQKAIGQLASLDLTPEINKFMAQLNEIINKALNTIDDLQNHAKEVGVDVAACINNSKNQIKNIGIEISKELTGCATGKVTEANDIIQSATREVQKSIQQVKAISAEFSSCGSGVSAVKCYTKVSAKIASAIAEFPAHISKEVAQAVALVTTLKNDLQSCAIDKISTAIPKVEDIVKTVTTCVTDKINSHKMI